ncbi:phytoene dehydrogenase [Aaosphaeria arxii CBS 175.79]|uniref:Phytoene desaturase n=1 Tax=Aaosphaeria arxii CBS 175.79 TaxID=1450172 RepID=A0A6A5XCU5_9PLEO|nr:phytoene dehydrogenase [Aaosphaeria arxii CBS 175.79]KAF2010739.1 phytoene dehydrogenase [Aaosphaeria arxii CBS 175.79]
MGRIRKPSVIIVGAGVGGVATAARLRKSGCEVTVIEKNDFTGGRCSLIHEDGYRFDQGPSLLLLPHLFHETFRELGTTMEDEGIKLVKCEPNYNIHFHDNTSFALSTDLAIMKSEIERFEGKDGFERYLSFLQEAHRHYEHSVTHVLKKNFYSLLSMTRPSFLRHVLQLHPFESIYGRASKYFWTERLRRVFTFASMYMGMSPFDAPGTYSLLQYTELAEGIWYPIGGFHKVVEGLVNVGKRLGVKYRLKTGISQILLSEDGTRAKGVILEGTNEVLEADVVICNADLVYSYTNLLPSTSYSKRLSKREASCSSISFYWGLDRRFTELSAHNIFLAENYRESFDSIFKKHLIPNEPSFYVNVPSRVDPTAAPEGCDTLVVLVPVGHLLDSMTELHKGKSNTSGTTQNWDSMVATARKTILATIESRLNISLAPHIVHQSINTPPTWRDRFNLDRGAILGLSHSFFNVLSFRPKTKHPNIKSLYFVGASTHPGTGVPIVLAGAKLVAEQVLSDRSLRTDWAKEEQRRRKEPKSGEIAALDRVQFIPLLSWIHMGFVLLIGLLLSIFGPIAARVDWKQGTGRFMGDWR